MVVNTVTSRLMQIGFSEYESRAYATLVDINPATAYELARASDIPTSKIYGVINRLAGKDMVTAIEDGEKRRYIPIDPEEFIDSFGAKVRGTLDMLKDDLSAINKGTGMPFVLNTDDREHLMEKATRMISGAQKTLLLSVWDEETRQLEAPLVEAESSGVKIAVVHFGQPGIKTGTVFRPPPDHTLHGKKGTRGLVVVADSGDALIGTITNKGDADSAEGAYSSNAGFVSLAEDYIKHDIYVMKILKRFDRQLRKMFGNEYEDLRDVFNDTCHAHRP
jgi:sugar-specific transcriptional regulator TrmB